MAKKQPTSAQEAWPQRQFVDKATQAVLPLLAVIVYSMAQLVRVGFQGNQYAFMLLVGILSIVCIFVYILASYTHGATGKKSIIGMLSAFAGFIPWLFGLYLVIYQGFWGFKELSAGFTIWIVIKALVAIFLGYRIINAMYQITEIDKSVKPSLDGATDAQKLDSLLAKHSNFSTAVKVDSSDEQLEFIDSHDPDQVLNFIKSEVMVHKGKRYEVLHYVNKVTKQPRTLYFDITAFPAD